MQYIRIGNLRGDKDITQQQMAEYLHCSQRCYSHYETGTRYIPTETLIKIADFHNVSIDYLLERTDKKEVNK